MTVPLSECVWLRFSRGDQLSQIAVNERAPCLRAATIAFISGHQAYVCKTDFRFALFFRNIKNNVRATPLAFVFHEVKVAVYHVPNDSFTRNKFCDLLFGTV